MIDFGFRFDEYFELSTSYFDHDYDVDTSKSELFWSLSGILAGPMIILPFSKNLYYDMSFCLGNTTGNLSISRNMPDNFMGK